MAQARQASTRDEMKPRLWDMNVASGLMVASGELAAPSVAVAPPEQVSAAPPVVFDPLQQLGRRLAEGAEENMEEEEEKKEYQDDVVDFEMKISRGFHGVYYVFLGIVGSPDTVQLVELSPKEDETREQTKERCKIVGQRLYKTVMKEIILGCHCSDVNSIPLEILLKAREVGKRIREDM